MQIKEGALVKAWDDYESVYFIDWYEKACLDGRHVLAAYSVPFKHAIEIPADLAKQLEELK